jgi:predicted ATPase/tRNA A-37 threonylcarbamoyl transferase component Bud32
MLTFSHYLLKEQLHQGEHALVYHAIRQTDNQSVILKILAAEYPTPEDIARLKHEYDLLHTFDNAVEGIIKVFGFFQEGNRYFIVLEDFGGQSIARFLPSYSFEMEDFLRIALRLVEILGELHRQKIIHKDINPSNILWNPNTQQIKLIDFGISTQLPRENTNLTNVNNLEGTLAYMAPEQTGRMNRAMDYRTDFYSTGATFYQMLTQKLPFETDEAMEMVHCHLAKMPIALDEINPKIPRVISQIVLKLMAKNAEDRYQSIFGLKTDLEVCWENLYSFKNLEGFSIELGQHDFSGQLQIPQKLYGRENEIQILLQAFERIVNPSQSTLTKGRCEMMLIAGYSGVGKTALVHEVHKPMTEKCGYLTMGKFEQFQKNIPYSAITQAFNEFCRYLLMESAETLANWQSKILNAVGNNGQIIIDVIPDLELVIGAQPAVAKVGPTEAQNRFKMFFLNFVKALCEPEHPFILFLDDLQWIDSASLSLLNRIMLDNEIQSLFIIGAYRDNEVDSSHPLMMAVDELQKANAIINRIQLDNLQAGDINHLLQDSLKAEQTQSLTDLIYQKTQGNAFFTHQFLQTLYLEGLLRFDFEHLKWQWNVEKIAAQNMTDNVVDLMIGQLQKLPEATWRMLRLAACIGNHFDSNTLSIISQYSTIEISQNILPALKEGLVQNTGKKAVKSSDTQNQTHSPLPIPHYQFLHDRVQQAAYALIPEFEKTLLHLKIGQLLLKNTTDEPLSENLFEIVDHLNLGLALVTSPVEKEEIARLNLKAGQKAKAATAYEAAVKYLDIGLKQLSSDCWENQYDLMLALHLEMVEAAYLNTQFEQSQALANTALKHAKTQLDQVKLYELKIQSYITHSQMTEALELGLHVLGLLGIELLKTPPIQEGNIEDLIDLPLMINPSKLAAIRILMTIMSPAFIANPALLGPISFTMVNLSLKEGHSPPSAYGYSFYGLILCIGINDIKSGYQFGQLALKLVNKLNAKEIKARTHELFHAFVRPWKEHPKDILGSLYETIQTGLETGDIEYVSYSASFYCVFPLLQGKSLESVERCYISQLEMVQKFRYEHILNYMKIWKQLVLNLRGKATERTLLIGSDFNETEMQQLFLETRNSTSLFGLYVAKGLLLYLLGELKTSVDTFQSANQYQEGGTSFITGANSFYYLLSLLAQYPNVDSDKQSQYLEQVSVHQEKLEKWAFHAPMNYQHKYDLVEAEKARIFGKNWEAIELYEKAIVGAKENQYLHEEALSYELAAKFYLDKGMNDIAQLYLKEAHYRYQQWGALAKVEDLEERYPQFLVQISQSTTLIDTLRSTTLATRKFSTTGSGRLSLLDLETVMKASQTIAGEVHLEKLLVHLMNIIIENAGAEKGFLLLEKDGQWLIEAEGTTNQAEIKVLQSVPINENPPPPPLRKGGAFPLKKGFNMMFPPLKKGG